LDCAGGLMAVKDAPCFAAARRALRAVACGHPWPPARPPAVWWAGRDGGMAVFPVW